MFPLGGHELWVVLLIVLILFGGAKIPQMMKGLGEGMKEFKKATREDDDDKGTLADGKSSSTSSSSSSVDRS